MKHTPSLKQAWMLIIIIALILPSVSIMIWYGFSIYKDKINTALLIKHHENKYLAKNIEINIQHLTTVLENKNDALAILLQDTSNPESLMQVNYLLKKIMDRNTLVHEILVISENIEVISVIEPDIGILGDKLLSKSELNTLKNQKGLNLVDHRPELIVPFHGKNYIGMPIEDHEINAYIFSISVPITVNAEVKAVLIAYVEVNQTWLMSMYNKNDIEFNALDFILNNKDEVIAISDVKKAEHLEDYFVSHSFTASNKNVSYTGLINESVYGIKTSIPTLNWTFVSEIKASLITDSIIAALLKLYLWTLLGIFIVMKLLFVMVNKTLKPIQNVCHVINKVANGDYEYSLKPSRITELDQLNSDVKNMIVERKKAEINLQNKYQLQAKEKEQREMLDSMVVSVMTIDTSGNILSCNKAAEQLFGYTSKEMEEMNINKLMPDSIAKNHDQYLETYNKTGHSHIIGVGRDLVGKNKDNKLFPMRLLIAELPLNADGVRRFIGSCIDLTDITKREEQYRRTQRMDALGKLTGGIAHDFNNMLGVILGYTQLLDLSLQKHQDTKSINYANEIKKAGERGAHLTNRLMSFSQQRISEVVSLNINELFLEENDMLKKTLTIRVKLILNLCDDIWQIKIDRNGLLDSIFNIVINAVYAMRKMKSAAQLSIITRNYSLTQKDANNLHLEIGDYVKMSFLDTGLGIDKNKIDKIFDPFYTTKGKDGTGLGLAQVFTFVKKHGGAIEVNSEEGLGTQFSLYFPRLCDESIVANQNLNDDNHDLTGDETILVVDDELAGLTQEMLQNQGYNVFSTGNGKEALEILKLHSIDLMISDIIMPEMDGYQLASVVQKLYPHIKIQLISGFNDQSNLNLVNKKLSENLLYKPFKFSSLCKRIRILLNEKNCNIDVENKNTKNKSAAQISSVKLNVKTGITNIDKEHSHLLTIMNKFFSMENQTEPCEEGINLLQQFLDASKAHFVNEELLLESLADPALIKHKMVHQLFLQHMQQFLNKYKLGELNIDSLNGFLLDWNENHIKGIDKTALSNIKIIDNDTERS